MLTGLLQSSWFPAYSEQWVVGSGQWALDLPRAATDLLHGYTYRILRLLPPPAGGKGTQGGLDERYGGLLSALGAPGRPMVPPGTLLTRPGHWSSYP